MESLSFFARDSRCIDTRMPKLVLLDVVVDAFEALEAFEEFICLIGVVQVGKVFPFDVESLIRG